MPGLLPGFRTENHESQRRELEELAISLQESSRHSGQKTALEGKAAPEARTVVSRIESLNLSWELLLDGLAGSINQEKILTSQRVFARHNNEGEFGVFQDNSLASDPADALT